MNEIQKTIIATDTLIQMISKCEQLKLENEKLKKENNEFQWLIKQTEPSINIVEKINKFLEN